MTVELRVLPCGPGWTGVCSVHGRLPVIWTDGEYAAWDVLGHGAAHHSTGWRFADAEDA